MIAHLHELSQKKHQKDVYTGYISVEKDIEILELFLLIKIVIQDILHGFYQPIATVSY